ncbi:MAG: methionine--tRNA ligase [Clostridia bacterium]|nr:methionine--tRNA ligase [Clostridia bacterium]
MKPKYYVTTAIPYTSRKPHIGNTYELILTDCIARYKRMRGYDVFMLTGTDEHGQKIEDAAKEAGISPKEYVDAITSELQGIWKKMNISYDKFIRTTDDYHVKAVQHIFKKLYDQGDIYKGEYEGWYCTPCESFWTETQASDGKCPDCGREVKKAKEAAYFLKLSKYQKKLEDYIESHPDFITPEARKKEMINNFIKPGIQDLCVSRSSFTWGIPVDFDEGHVIYVWIDALTNYITALGYDVDKQDDLYKKNWPADLQIIGKDILRFHTIYWPVILMALGQPLPKQILGHPWLLSGMDKMSKSRGNVMYADYLSDLLGTDAVRYYVLAEMPFLNDGSITYEMLVAKINSDLVNTLGNLVQRTVAMINKYFDGYIPAPAEKGEFDDDLISVIKSGYEATTEKFETLHIADATDEIMTVLRRLNKYIDETMPWALAKDEEKKPRLATVLYNLTEGIRICANMLYPFIPESAEKILDQLNNPENKENLSIGDWDENAKFGHTYPVNTKVNPSPTPLFMRIDEKEFNARLEADRKAAEKAEKAEEKSEKTEENNSEIAIDDFMKVKLRCAEILECVPVENSEKLLKITVNDGKGRRQIVSGIAKSYSPDELIGKKIIIISNLKPAKIRGVESNGMLLAASAGDKVKVVFLDESVEPGAEIR